MTETRRHRNVRIMVTNGPTRGKKKGKREETRSTVAMTPPISNGLCYCNPFLYRLTINIHFNKKQIQVSIKIENPPVRSSYSCAIHERFIASYHIYRESFFGRLSNIELESVLLLLLCWTGERTNERTKAPTKWWPKLFRVRQRRNIDPKGRGDGQLRAEILMHK